MNFLAKSWHCVSGYQKSLSTGLQNLMQSFVFRYYGFQLVDVQFSGNNMSTNYSQEESLESLLKDVLHFGVPKSKVIYVITVLYVRTHLNHQFFTFYN